MDVTAFDYHLPPERIAQEPLPRRDEARLLVLHRRTGAMEHRRFKDLLEILGPQDVLVLNDTRVIPARLRGVKEPTGGKAEFLLLREREPGLWEALAKPGRRLQPGTVVRFSEALTARIVGRTEAGTRLLLFSDREHLREHLARLGEVPLPPYIHRPLEDSERYQTVYARKEGAAAAPTAGLHFTHELLEALKQKGVQMEFITLHVGLDTFRPIQTRRVEDHDLHAEYIEVSPETAEALNQARAQGKRLVAVGTTTVRTLETVADEEGHLHPYQGWTRLYITPGYRFKAVDALITNFHMPRTTLLVLVCTFGGRELVLQAYQEALREGYRFLSFGDAMLIL